jgi:nitrogen fixation-related uncharacterized protein
MISSFDTVFLAAWVVFVCLIFAAVAGAVVWAARSGQFKDQDRARYLPLMSGIPEKRQKDGAN